MTTSINFPTSRLTLPTISGYGIEPQEGVARTDMDSGPARHRRRWTRTPTNFPVVWKFTRYQLAIFEGWYYNDAAEGAAFFNIPLLSGLGLVTHEARFRGPYKSSPWNGSADANAEWWRISATLEIRDRPVLDAGATAIVIDSDISLLFATIDAFTHLVEHEMPT